MLQYFSKFMPSKRRDEEGASAVEYGLLVALIAAVVVVAVVALGGVVNGAFETTCTAVQDGGTITSTTEDCP